MIAPAVRKVLFYLNGLPVFSDLQEVCDLYERVGVRRE